uniref:Uncharacterized protein n=1 Tax=Oryza glaberrima TaxID=4538 RepID=I1PS25_ORYGL
SFKTRTATTCSLVATSRRRCGELSERRWCNASFQTPADENTLADWWLATRRCFRTSYRTDFDSAFMLICWLIWKERNARIFQHVSKTLDQPAEDIKEEIAVWGVAGIFSQFRE